MQMQTIGRAALAGVAGAFALTAVHESVRQVSRRAPRMDVVAKRGIAQFVRLGRGRDARRLHALAMIGDLASNSAYYTLVGIGRARGAPWRGAVLGLLAGIGALVLPRHMGLGDPPHSADGLNRAMTVGWYLLGGVVAGLAHRGLARE